MTDLQIRLWNDALWWFEVSTGHSDYSADYSVEDIRFACGWQSAPGFDVEVWFNLFVIEALS